MGSVDQSPALADAADVLSDQLRAHLRGLAALLAPHVGGLERRFLSRLRRQGLDIRQRKALAAITPGQVARVVASGEPASAFFEEAEYSGRRLAKLNLPPQSIIAALQEYDSLLTPLLRQLDPSAYANHRWVREQLQFCVVLTVNKAYYQVREAEARAFYDLFQVEVAAQPLESLLGQFLRVLADFCRADGGQISLLNESGTAFVTQAALHHRDASLPPPMRVRPARLKRLGKARCFAVTDRTARDLLDPGWAGLYGFCWSIPLTSARRTAGVIQFAFESPYEWLPRELDLLTAAAERCLAAAEKARLMEDLAARERQVRHLAEVIREVEEVERRRISRELHDEAGQSLLCIRLQLEMLEARLPKPLRADVAATRELAAKTVLEIRRLISALSPAVLEKLGLGAALRQLVTRFREACGCQVRLRLGELGGVPKATETMIYRLVQECCNNIGKHAGATRVTVTAGASDGLFRLHVQDNGVGFHVREALAQRGSFGLSGMRERVALLGGRFEARSRPAGKARHGTDILIELPLRKEPSETAETGDKP